MELTQEQVAYLITEKTESLLNDKIVKIDKLTKGCVNQTYKVSTELNDYVFRIFASKSWPECGKIEFINKNLNDKKIECVDIIIINRSDDDFLNGYMIEKFINGQNADDAIITIKNKTEYYEKLAVLVSKIHKISIVHYGYIGSGVANYTMYKDFIASVCDVNIKKVAEMNLLSKNELTKIKETIIEHLSKCKMPSVLCHGDISLDNVMIMNNENRDLVLIDWDNATSGIWISDFSIMTYWMKLSMNETDYNLCRNVFLNNYHTDYPVKDLDVLEKVFHLLQGIQLLSFYQDEKLLELTLRHVIQDHKWIGDSFYG